jgi:hypothetical protein
VEISLKLLGQDSVGTEVSTCVSFETPRFGKLVAIDGTSCRDCEILDLSQIGARLRIGDSLGNTQEFFLLLTNFGAPVFRRCKVLRVQGDRLDVEFPSRNIRPKHPPRNPNALVY